MISAILSIIAYLLPLVVEGVKAGQAKQKGSNHEANIQEVRKALNDGNRPAVAAGLADQHDRVLAAVRSNGR